MKQITTVRSSPAPHWVGDGFPVRTVISPRGGKALGPFVLMDFAGPFEFEPSDSPRGVETHPHKGFETVTIIFEGEVEHRDSVGNSGKIGPGDVQWMTAASGILHEEMHSKAFTAQGGVLEMAQIWVNLPAKNKTADPGYQSLLASDIPKVKLPDDLGSVGIVAGDYLGTKGAARTFTPINMWTVTIESAGEFVLPIPEGQLGGVYVREGAVRFGDEVVHATEIAEFPQNGAGLPAACDGPTSLIVLSGEPIDEPMVAHGPFVMNTSDEIREAILEFQSGRFGSIPARAHP